jgi:orotidine-5'-phosphate decarboxylase
MTRHCWNMLNARWGNGCHVCVGLDSAYAKIPNAFKDGNVTQAIYTFNAKIVRETMHVACAYKPNLAFYLEQGIPGLTALIDTVRFIRDAAPEVPVILDGKFGDIGNTSDAYATFAYEQVLADAVTLNPYMGIDAAQAFQRTDKGIFVLCRTSNDSAEEFQTTVVHQPLYQKVAAVVATKWCATGHYGLVVGATAPTELAEVRHIVGDDIPILIPGIGAQGGNLEATVKAGKNSRGNGMVINSSRDIIFHENPALQAEKLNDQIKSFL